MTSSRRQILEKLGIGAGSLFLPSLMGDKQAYAQRPRRLVITHMGWHGPVYDAWRMRRPGLPEDRDWEIPLKDVAESELGDILKPLHALRNDLIVVDGLFYGSRLSITDPKVANHHIIGMAQSLTNGDARYGSGPNGNGIGTSPSVDQIIANAVAASGKQKYLYFGEYTGNKNSDGSPVYSSPSGSPVNFETDPALIFNRLWPGGGTPPPPGENPNRRSVEALAVAKNEFERMAAGLSSDDRRKLEQHRDLVEDLRQQLAVTSGPGPGCSAPPKPASGLGYPNRTPHLIKIMAAAMACDIARVGVVYRGQLTTADIGAPSSLDIHADISHAAFPGTDMGTHMVNYTKLHINHFRDLVSQLKANGELANTAVVWTSQISNSVHFGIGAANRCTPDRPDYELCSKVRRDQDLVRLLFIIAGSCGGAFKTGRYVKYAQRPHPGISYDIGPVGPPHSKLLVSLMNAMGVNQSWIGFKESRGVDLTGPLHGLDRSIV